MSAVPRFVRRVVALLVCLSLIRPGLMGGLLACGAHDMAEMSRHARLGAGAEGHGEHAMTNSLRAASSHVAAASGERPLDHAAPESSDCCGAAASCSLLAIVAAVDANDVAAMTADVSHAEPVTRRVAITMAPELPPPRA